MGKLSVMQGFESMLGALCCFGSGGKPGWTILLNLFHFSDRDVINALRCKL